MKLLDLIKFDTHDGKMTLKDYVDKMKENQPGIYYLSNSDLEQCKKSPFNTRVLTKNYNIVYFNEGIDEFMIQSVNTYKDKKLIDISRENIDLGQVADNSEELIKDFEVVCKNMKDVLGDSITKVQVSKSELGDEIPCILTASAYGWNNHMEKLMKSQVMRDNQMNFMSGQKILEINPKHEMIQQIKKLVENDDKKMLNNLIRILYDTTCIGNGYDLNNPVEYMNKIYKILSLGMSGESINVEDEVVKEIVNESNEESSIMENVD